MKFEIWSVATACLRCIADVVVKITVGISIFLCRYDCRLFDTKAQVYTAMYCMMCGVYDVDGSMLM